MSGANKDSAGRNNMAKCKCDNDGWPLLDAAGIYCGIVCDKCEDKMKAKYRPEIFDDPDYWTEEPKEPEEF